MLLKVNNMSFANVKLIRVVLRAWVTIARDLKRHRVFLGG